MIKTKIYVIKYCLMSNNNMFGKIVSYDNATIDLKTNFATVEIHGNKLYFDFHEYSTDYYDARIMADNFRIKKVLGLQNKIKDLNYLEFQLLEK